MIRIISLTVLLLACVSPSHVAAFFNQPGEGNSGSIPGIPIIPSCCKQQEKEKQTLVQIQEFKINVNSIKVDVDNKKLCIEKEQKSVHPGGGPIIQPLDASTPVFPDAVPSTEPETTETVLGELSTPAANISTQGLPGVLPSLYISSFTYKIDYDFKGKVPILTFVIRGKGFDVTKFIPSTLLEQIADILEPRVYLGSICLKVVKFEDDYILARFEDIDEQKHFLAGSYNVVVKVLDILHVPIIGKPIIGTTSDVSAVGGLTIPELGIVGPSFPVFPITSPLTSNPLIQLFNGLKFQVAKILAVFSQQDADRIRQACKTFP